MPETSPLSPALPEAFLMAHLGGLAVTAAVAHLRTQPVPGAVHVAGGVVAVLDSVFQRAALIAVEQGQVELALRQHLGGGLVRVGESRFFSFRNISNAL